MVDDPSLWSLLGVEGVGPHEDRIVLFGGYFWTDRGGRETCVWSAIPSPIIDGLERRRSLTMTLWHGSKHIPE